LDFNIRHVWLLEIGGLEIPINQTIVNTWIIMGVLILGALLIRIRLRKMKEVPGKLQNVVEAIIEGFDKFVASMAGEKLTFLGGWFFMIFTFLLVSNLSGLVGLRPPTADWGTTLAIALVSFFLIQTVGFYAKGFGYIAGFFKPIPIFSFVLNVIGELARPISLSFRLFGNILSGVILMAFLYNLAPVAMRFIFPVALHVYFDVFVGVLQAYIFCALSLSFIGSATLELE